MAEEQQISITKKKKRFPKSIWVIAGLFAFIIILASGGGDRKEEAVMSEFSEETVETTEGIIETTGEPMISEMVIESQESVISSEPQQQEPISVVVISNCNSEQIDVNTASREDLMRIIHIDEVRVDDLIKKRPFRSVDDLTRIIGIASVRLNDIKEQGLACAN